MGFQEDDRIRSKNLVHNIAEEEYNSLKEQRYSDSDIVQLYTNKPSPGPGHIRHDINIAVIKLAGGLSEKVSN